MANHGEDEPPPQEYESIAPRLPFSVFDQLFPMMSVYDRLLLRRVNREWRDTIPKTILRVVFINRVRNILGPNGHICDYELQLYGNDILWLRSYEHILGVVQICNTLRVIKLFYLDFEDKHLLIRLGEQLQRIESLELYHCSNLSAADIRQIVSATYSLNEFLFTSLAATPNLPVEIQVVLDQNRSLTTLKLCDGTRTNVWDLEFRQPLHSLHLRLEIIGLNFWQSLLRSSQHSLRRFTSEYYRVEHHHWLQDNFPTLQYLRFFAFAAFGNPGPQDMRFINLNVLAMRYPIPRVYEHLDGPIQLQANLQILDFRSVQIHQPQTLVAVCETCPNLRIFRFHVPFILTNDTANSVRQLTQLEELQYFGHIPFSQELDNIISGILQDLPLRVFITNAGVGDQTKQAMVQKANADATRLYFIDMGPMFRPMEGNPQNLKWIRQHEWTDFFSTFRSGYFDWKRIRNT